MNSKFPIETEVKPRGSLLVHLLTGLAGKYQWLEFPVVITGKYRPGKYSKF